MPGRRVRRPTEVFLSHASADRALAAALAQTLRNHGVRVWHSETNIAGAEQWHDEIGAALARCDWFIVLLTSKSVKSIWVKRETVTALNDRRYENRIVPVMARKCEWRELSWTLGSIQMVRLSRRYVAGLRELLAIWRIDLDETECVKP